MSEQKECRIIKHPNHHEIEHKYIVSTPIGMIDVIVGSVALTTRSMYDVQKVGISKHIRYTDIAINLVKLHLRRPYDDIDICKEY